MKLSPRAEAGLICIVIVLLFVALVTCALVAIDAEIPHQSQVP